jgi:hypothetical protein
MQRHEIAYIVGYGEAVSYPGYEDRVGGVADYPFY